jgi:hypothetical protein
MAELDLSAETSLESLVTALRRQMGDAFPITRVPDRDELGTDPMDPIVGRYLEEELDRRVDQELARISYEPSEWVSGPGRDLVDRAHRNLRASVTTAVSVPTSRWEAMLDQATAAACRFVVSPVATLASEVFQLRADSVSTSVARSRVRALAGHPAITDAADAWLAEADEPVQRRTFVRALRAIVDDLMDHEDAWIGTAEPLFALHERVNGKRLVPVGRLQTLYKDLGLDDIAERIGELAFDSGVSAWTDSTLFHALSAPADEPLLIDDEPTIETRTQSATASATESEKRSPDIFYEDVTAEYEPTLFESADTTAEVSQPVEKAVPLWMRFQTKINAPMKPGAPVTPPGSNPGRNPGRNAARLGSQPATTSAVLEKSVRPLWERYRKPDVRSEISAAPRADFDEVERFVLGDVDRSRREDYIETLFGGRAATYREMVYRLAELGTWPEATAIIADEVFRRNRVNIYSEVAIDFTNAVEKRYKR